MGREDMMPEKLEKLLSIYILTYNRKKVNRNIYE